MRVNYEPNYDRQWNEYCTEYQNQPRMRYFRHKTNKTAHAAISGPDAVLNYSTSDQWDEITRQEFEREVYPAEICHACDKELHHAWITDNQGKLWCIDCYYGDDDSG